MNLMIRQAHAICILLVAILITSLCTSCNDDSEGSSQLQVYKKDQLLNLYNNEIIPLSIALTKETEALVTVTKHFQAEATVLNLQAVQQQWKAMQVIWKQLELYDIGKIADSFISFEINRWPTDPLRIDSNIASTAALNLDYITSLGSSSKGISGIEYLIFYAEAGSTILDKFTIDEKAARRHDYLVALTQNLQSKSIALKHLWDTEKENFTTALENGIKGSQNQVINAMVTLIEETIISKLGKPLGDTNGGTVELQRLEAYYSGFSKEILQQHLVALHRCYTGDFTETSTKVGFDDILNHIGSKKLSSTLITQFSVCQKKLDAIQGTLKEEITTHPEKIIALKNSFRELLVLIKVDMATILGTTITFNDNDGD
ncbi:imelysin family protein [Aquimarina longa]|uniref:imelysin family protein n=1 Tax=Aquimarina longa TaxID=1080221 RepID=UPI0007867241|nr:imelysin family protein [Aquimarina longa]